MKVKNEYAWWFKVSVALNYTYKRAENSNNSFLENDAGICRRNSAELKLKKHVTNLEGFQSLSVDGYLEDNM